MVPSKSLPHSTNNDFKKKYSHDSVDTFVSMHIKDILIKKQLILALGQRFGRRQILKMIKNLTKSQ